MMWKHGWKDGPNNKKLTELKTLKDMEDQVVIFGNVIKCLYANEVKAEAIKWVKSYQGTLENVHILKKHIMYYKGCIGALKKFHNIIEEDLA